MRQAIKTKYLCPTNFRGARVKATAEAGSLTVPWDHALNVEDNHAVAAKMLCQRYGWQGHYSAGGTKDGYVFVYAAPIQSDKPHNCAYSVCEVER